MSNASAPSSATPAAPQADTSATPVNTSQELLEGESIEEASASTETSKEASKAPQAAKGEAKIESKADKAADKVDAEKTSDGTYKMKVDGEEIELSREEVIKYAQMGKAGQKRMAEASQIKKEAQQLVQMLRDNPEAVLADPAILGSDEKVIELAQKILSRALENEQKSPETKQKEALEKELEDLRRKVKDDEERKSAEEYERMVSEQESQLEEQITEAIETSGLPKSPFVLKRLADVLLAAAENDKDVSPKQAMNIVKREMQKDLREYIEALQDDALEEVVSADKIKKLRQRQLAKLKAEQAKAAPTMTDVKETASAPQEDQKKSKISMKDFLRGR